jgi:hypothetical protein
VEVKASDRKVLPLEAIKKTEEILKKNDELFNAFLKKDLKSAEAHSKALYQMVHKSAPGILKSVSGNAPSLKEINASASLEKNLEHYEKFLNPLIQIVKVYKVPAQYNIFSCPMVNKSWIQDVKTNQDVRNVFAMEMLECGTQDTKF